MEKSYAFFYTGSYSLLSIHLRNDFRYLITSGYFTKNNKDYISTFKAVDQTMNKVFLTVEVEY